MRLADRVIILQPHRNGYAQQFQCEHLNEFITHKWDKLGASSYIESYVLFNNKIL